MATLHTTLSNTATAAPPKTCTRCGRAKSLDHFYQRERGKLASHCKACVEERRQRRRPPRRRAHVANALRLADLPALGDPRVAARFWSWVAQAGPSDCWLTRRRWNGRQPVTFRIGARTLGAARVAYALTYGDIPADLYVCHRCDDPRCMNPAHLFLDTPAGNTADRERKHRGRSVASGPLAPPLPASAPRRLLSARERLALQVTPGAGDDCWLWRGSTCQGGYGYAGKVRPNGPKWGAHRVAYEAAYGPIPRGMLVRHTCAGRYDLGDITYRRCCNPAHLELGTLADNVADRVADGRSARGARHGSRTQPKKHRH